MCAKALSRDDFPILIQMGSLTILKYVAVNTVGCLRCGECTMSCPAGLQLMGEMINDVVANSIKPLLNPALTASWEKGLTGVADGSITSEEYMQKLTDFVGRRTFAVKQLTNQPVLFHQFDEAAQFYKK